MGIGGALAVVDAVLWPIALRRARHGRTAWFWPVSGGGLVAGTF
jgi:hypothetical protein